MNSKKKLQRQIELQQNQIDSPAWLYYLLSGVLWALFVGGLSALITFYGEEDWPSSSTLLGWFAVHFLGGALFGVWQRWYTIRHIKKLQAQLNEQGNE